MKAILYICIGITLLTGMYAEQLSASEHYCFRVYLKDKTGSPCVVEQPEGFLSVDAIQRRSVREKPVTEADLPVSPAYIDALTAEGTTLVVTSKWMNTVVVSTPDSLVINRLSQLSMVDSVKWIWKGDTDNGIGERPDEVRYELNNTLLKSPYGHAEKQIRMHNGDKLHKTGFRGEGMRVAVIDAGFLNVDRIAAFDSLRLIGTHNVRFPGHTVFDDDEHGTKVLSCLAAHAPGLMVGTAPKASYLLIKSEDASSEYPIEEDYWVAAVEYADSAGVDVITTSLGYFEYDADELSYSHSNLDGQTAFISRAAAMAADKGILIFCSAGNEGDTDWGKITFPSDVATLLTIGSVTREKQHSYFSSIGLTADNRVKPDVVALGSACCVVDETGNISYSNGTSFATPVMAGLGICLWQALPSLTNLEIINLIRQASSLRKKPDAELGYGLPDIYKAYKTGRKHVSYR